MRLLILASVAAVFQAFLVWNMEGAAVGFAAAGAAVIFLTVLPVVPNFGVAFRVPPWLLAYLAVTAISVGGVAFFKSEAESARGMHDLVERQRKTEIIVSKLPTIEDIRAIVAAAPTSTPATLPTRTPASIPSPTPTMGTTVRIPTPSPGPAGESASRPFRIDAVSLDRVVGNVGESILVSVRVTNTAPFAIPLGADPLVKRPNDPTDYFYSPSTDVDPPLPTTVVAAGASANLEIVLKLDRPGVFVLYGAAYTDAKEFKPNSKYWYQAAWDYLLTLTVRS